MPDTPEHAAKSEKFAHGQYVLKAMDARQSPHPSAKLHLEILHLAKQIRANPTVPADPANPEQPLHTVFDVSVAPKLPRKH
eukprot:4302757-Karenia_brevis.AAC.1